MPNQIPPKLQEIVEDFQWAEGREKLEMLLEYAERLPDLPAFLDDQQDQMEKVEECMTPVFIESELTGGRMFFHFSVPKESPTVRGFAALMAEGLNGTTPEAILQVPGDFFQQMGLQDVLTHQRMNGMTAILAYMKRLARKHLEQAAG